MATDREEQQRRELEQIRRDFAEIGQRVGSMFEPAQQDRGRTPNGNGRSAPPAPTAPATAEVQPEATSRQRPTWAVTAAIALGCLLIGSGLTLLASGPAANEAGPPRTSIVIREVPSRTPPKVVVPDACLRTTQLGDQTVNWLIENRERTRRLTEILRAYTRASQACREEASP